MAVSEKQKIIFPKEQKFKKKNPNHTYRYWGGVEVLQNPIVLENQSIYSEKHMLWQPNTTGRNRSCSAEHHSSQLQLVSIPVTLPESSQGWLPQPLIRGLSSRGEVCLSLPYYNAACSQQAKTAFNIWWLTLPLFRASTQKSLLRHNPSPASLDTTWDHVCSGISEQPQGWFSSWATPRGFSPRWVTPNPSKDPALLPSTTVPMGRTWLKATDQPLLTELRGKHWMQHVLCTAQERGQ